MVMSVEERVRKASAARVIGARRRRFTRYAEEMSAHPAEMPGAMLALVVDGLRDSGWTVTPPAPVDEQKAPATTQPAGR